MTTFRPVAYPEDPSQRRFQRVERHVVEDQVIEHLGPVFRVAAPQDAHRTDAVTVVAPDDFGFYKLVPVDA